MSRRTVRHSVVALAVMVSMCAALPAATAEEPAPGDELMLLSEPQVGPVEAVHEVGPSLDMGAAEPSETSEGLRGPTARSSSTSLKSPAGCTGATDYPHKSGNDAAVHGRITCRSAVARLETATVLTRDRWFGPEQIKSDTSWTEGKRTSEDAHPHFNCKGTGTFTYRGYSQHASLEGKTIYKASTSNWEDPGRSRFSC